MKLMRVKMGPGRFAPALFLSLAALAVPAAAQPVAAQPLVSPVPVPDQLELSKLIWSTMAAVDHANLAGNYSVLRDLAAPSFQVNNDAARLTQIFAAVRASGIDLSNALLLAPTLTGPPTLIARDVLRVQGLFGLRPTAILFDLQYQWVAGRWRLFGVSIGSQSIATQQPGAAVRPPPPRPGGR